MAIALEFINFIVRRDAIDARYPGGWAKCLRDHRPLLGGRVYYDRYLFRDGAMGPAGIDLLLKQWRDRGIEPSVDDGDGQQVAADVCVIPIIGGGLWPCSWLTRKGLIAYMTGTEPGRLAGPLDVRLAIAKAHVSLNLEKIADPSAGVAE